VVIFFRAKHFCNSLDRTNALADVYF